MLIHLKVAEELPCLSAVLYVGCPLKDVVVKLVHSIPETEPQSSGVATTCP